MSSYDSFQDDEVEGVNSFLGIIYSEDGSGLAASLEKLGMRIKLCFGVIAYGTVKMNKKAVTALLKAVMKPQIKKMRQKVKRL